MAAPVIGWRNEAEGSSYTVLTGTEVVGYELRQALDDWNTLRPALITADSNGEVTVQITLPDIGYSFGELPFGMGPFGGLWPIDALAIGAHRHDPAGARFASGRVQLSAGGTVLFDDPYVSGADTTYFKALPEHTRAHTYTLTISGQAPGETVHIPHIYLGPLLWMPHLDLGFDPYAEVSIGRHFESESGAIYATVLARRLEPKASWSLIPREYWTAIDFFREETVETMRPFVWAWDYESAPSEIYYCRNRQRRLEFPIRSAAARALRIDMAELV